MRILITGADGMLGGNIIKLWSDKYDLYLTGKRQDSIHLKSNYLSFDLRSDNYTLLLNTFLTQIIIDF